MKNGPSLPPRSTLRWLLSSTSHFFFSLLLGIGVLFDTSTVLAQPQLSVARGEGASSCPDASELQLQIEAILGRPMSSEENANIHLSVEIFTQNSGFFAIIRVAGDRQGERSLQDPGTDCIGLRDALAVSLAMLLDARELPPENTKLVVVNEQPKSPPAPIVSLPSSVSSFSARTWLGGGIKTGIFSSIRPSLTAGFELNLSRIFFVGLDAFWLSAEQIPLGPGHVNITLAAGSLRSCTRWSPHEKFSLGGCGLIAAGGFRASGSGFRENRTAGPNWLALGAGVFASGPWTERLGWLLRLDGTWSSREQRFFVQDVGETAALPRLGLGVTAGISFRFF